VTLKDALYGQLAQGQVPDDVIKDIDEIVKNVLSGAVPLSYDDSKRRIRDCLQLNPQLFRKLIDHATKLLKENKKFMGGHLKKFHYPGHAEMFLQKGQAFVFARVKRIKSLINSLEQGLKSALTIDDPRHMQLERLNKALLFNEKRVQFYAAHLLHADMRGMTLKDRECEFKIFMNVTMQYSIAEKRFMCYIEDRNEHTKSLNTSSSSASSSSGASSASSSSTVPSSLSQAALTSAKELKGYVTVDEKAVLQPCCPDCRIERSDDDIECKSCAAVMTEVEKLLEGANGVIQEMQSALGNAEEFILSGDGSIDDELSVSHEIQSRMVDVVSSSDDEDQDVDDVSMDEIAEIVKSKTQSIATTVLDMTTSKLHVREATPPGESPLQNADKIFAEQQRNTPEMKFLRNHPAGDDGIYQLDDFSVPAPEKVQGTSYVSPSNDGDGFSGTTMVWGVGEEPIMHTHIPNLRFMVGSGEALGLDSTNFEEVDDNGNPFFVSVEATHGVLGSGILFFRFGIQLKIRGELDCTL